MGCFLEAPYLNNNMKYEHSKAIGCGVLCGGSVVLCGVVVCVVGVACFVCVVASLFRASFVSLFRASFVSLLRCFVLRSFVP